ncbi:hypothetical protein [Paraburkholderia unamae]|uniref:Uncharacterized protein n=1 Tax=Paraburkholderia unamae TaxID=219649 RepID=A0ABX5KAM0_9BURK|nr:hypothetical protein [Paraburkholderia unamae]PVX61242.1 hypothetical protein C7402_14233 [Paraburkholderia unamae]
MATQESTLSLKKNNDVPSNATVTVASKSPFDITLKLYDLVEQNEPVLGGGFRTFKQFRERVGAPTFMIQGNSWPQNKGPHQQIVGGYAITHGIPKAFWDEWLEQNENADYVKNKMIFAHTEAASVTSKAADQAEIRSNMERLDPSNLPRGLQESTDMRRPS